MAIVSVIRNAKNNYRWQKRPVRESEKSARRIPTKESDRDAGQRPRGRRARVASQPVRANARSLHNAAQKARKHTTCQARCEVMRRR